MNPFTVKHIYKVQVSVTQLQSGELVSAKTLHVTKENLRSVIENLDKIIVELKELEK